MTEETNNQVPLNLDEPPQPQPEIKELTGPPSFHLFVRKDCADSNQMIAEMQNNEYEFAITVVDMDDPANEELVKKHDVVKTPALTIMKEDTVYAGIFTYVDPERMKIIQEGAR